MLKTLALGMAIGSGITGAGAALAQIPRKPAPADIPRLLLIDDDHKHKNKHDKHFNRRGDDDEDRDEDDNRSRRSSSRTSRGSSSSSQGYQGYYGSSPYQGTQRGYGGHGLYAPPVHYPDKQRPRSRADGPA